MNYDVDWEVLNTKDYGLPQNRERIIIVGFRKDLGVKEFNFPKGFDNGLRLKDMLESEVDEKYYIAQDKVEKLLTKINKKEIVCSDKPELVGGIGEINYGKQYRQGNRVYSSESPAMCLLSQPVGNTGGNSYLYAVANKNKNEIIQIGMLDIKGNEQIRRVYSDEWLSPTISTMQGGNRQPKVLENNLKFVGGIDTEQTDKWIKDDKSLSRNYKEGYRVYDTEGIASCQKANGGGIGSYTGLYLEPKYRIRKLTPRECWRLQGFSDEYHDLVAENMSETQRYKQAGNAVSSIVIKEVFKEIIKNINIEISTFQTHKKYIKP